ncbi:hypothetical protein [Sphingomonas sp. 8AM]|uniref:hypothetical protein n=1 Tax=Sphingomonas sp. 8AM TaxID=2653170 RepID=UPI0012F28B21|nr:hypothetical protein [Sphingomonas sp. 8AM]VXD01146.1 conserved exported hypothetical protein [Sphingomonas sp. 8AM]
MSRSTVFVPVFGAILVSCLSGVASADPASPDRSGVADAVLRCRTIAGDAARLKCFDAAAGALNGAIAARQVVVVDRARVEAERRARFGERRRAADLPTLQDADGNRLDTLTGKLAQAARTGDGNWSFTLADGSRWLQTDGQAFAVAPRSGETVVVKRAALGSYKLTVGRQPGVRVRRRS